MAYVILRTEKYKTRNTIAGLVGHHLRIPGSKLDNGSDWGRVLQSAVESQETAGPSPFN